MIPPLFVHLRVHSEFSIADGLTRIDDLIRIARADGQGAIALTDVHNLFGLIKFYTGARSAGIKPIAGVDVAIANPKDRDTPHRLLLLVRDRVGYGQLCELLTRGFLENQYRGRPELRSEWLTSESTSGLFVLSGAMAGEVGLALSSGGDGIAQASALAEKFKGRFFIELQRSGTEESEFYTQKAAQLAAQLHLPVVATHPVQFAVAEDFRAHEARVCISDGEILGNPRRVKRYTAEQYLKSQAQMQALFADVPSALANSVAIAQACNLSLELGKPKLPQFPTPAGMTLDAYLVHLSRQGLEKRLLQCYASPTLRESKRAEYEARLNTECQTIIKMGFPGYFLIVQDFINWGKANGVPVGPGRGSGAGSLVAYCLGITDIDPLPYDLLFERFLNPERVSMPDFDIDFCQDNRDKVIDYVKRQYGKQSVSQIVTFGTLGAKAVIRDVGRVLDMPYKYCDGLSKLIPHVPTDPWDLKRAMQEEPNFKERVESEEEAKEIIELALPLEGVTRNVGMHAGGVLIAPGKLTDFCPLYCAEGSEDNAVSQYDKDDVEAIGLVKFDFLGLRNLTILELAVQYVRRFNADRANFSLEDIASFDDKKTYQLLADGNTTAVFQMESRGARDLCKRLKPTVFEDIIAMMALNRPGPLGSGMVDDFIVRSKEQRQTGKGNPRWYFHADLEPVLRSTYGVMVYQEQVMLVAQILAGYSLGSADLLRRAMGKKKKEEMDAQREQFTQGAISRGVDAQLATQLFDLMAKFADYGFNKSHSAAYAVLGYQTAWLKCHYPAEYMSATLSSDMDATDKVQIFYADTLAQKVRVLAPDINASEYRFVPVPDAHSEKNKPTKTIRYGLGAIKGTGQSAVDAIVAERTANGPFKNLFEFCRRVDKRMVNRRAVEALIRAGAFDSLNDHRAQLLANVDAALAAAEAAAAHTSQNSLFGEVEDVIEDIALAEVPRFDERKKLADEKAALGYYFSGHLFDAYKPEVSKVVPKRLAQIQSARGPQTLAGMVMSLRTQIGKRGKMAFIQLEDGQDEADRIEVAVFSEAYEQARQWLKEDELVIVVGTVKHDSYNDRTSIVADQLLSLDEMRTRYCKKVQLHCTGSLAPAQLKALLAPHLSAQGVPVELKVTSQQVRYRIMLGEKYHVLPHEALAHMLAQTVNNINIVLVYG
jgi:DNA polymerase-3 subunit alpha